MASKLNSICRLWQDKLALARTYKRDVFGNQADECWRFFTGPHDFVYEMLDAKKYRYSQSFSTGRPSAPMFKVTFNKAAELVQLFLPVLYHRNPTREVLPRGANLAPQLLQQLQMMGLQVSGEVPLDKQIIAGLLNTVLDYTPGELDLRRESRLSITEALVKGRGLLWTEVVPGANRWMVGSFFGSVDDLLIDPDAQTLRDAKFVARRRLQPIWEVSRKFGIPHHKLEGACKSFAKRSEDAGLKQHDAYDRQIESTNDLVEYWEIYSRMGVGGRLHGADENLRNISESFPENCYLAVCRELEFPLNLPDDLDPNQLGLEEELQARLSWPIPFHDDATHPWPFTELDFHEMPKCVWPASHLGFALGEQLFLDWAYTFLANKVRHSSRGVWLLSKEVAQEFRRAIEEGMDNEVVEIPTKNARQKLDELVKYLGEPGMNTDLLTVLQQIERNFEKRTGLSELMYGMTNVQMRSASEARVKEGQLNVRPDDMAQMVENWMGLAARKEAIATSLLLSGEDVAPIFCEHKQPPSFDPQTGMPMPSMSPFSDLWDQLVHNRPVEEVVSEFSYTIESGSARKPNRERQISNIDESAQVVLPLLQGYFQMSGDPTPINAWVTEWARSRDFDVTPFLLPDMRQQMAMQQQQMQEQQMQGAPSA